MGTYLARRIAALAITLLGVVVLTFVVSRVIPGDPAALAAGPTATRETIERVREDRGLNDPLPVQFISYMSDLSRMDFGTSILTRRQVRDDLIRLFPATLELVSAAFLLYIVIGVPLGVVAARWHGKWPDIFARGFSIVAYATPLFVIALWLQYTFFFQLGVLPSGGRIPILMDPPPRVTGFYTVDSLVSGDIALFMTVLRYLVLPVTALALTMLAVAVRFTRASMLDEMDAEYVTMCRLRGLSERRILLKHVLRNSLVPVVTMSGAQLGYLIGGVGRRSYASVVVENVKVPISVTCFCHQALNLSRLRDIRRDSRSLSPLLAHEALSLACCVDVNISDNYLGPFFRKPEGCCTAHTPSSACNHGNFVRQARS